MADDVPVGLFDHRVVRDAVVIFRRVLRTARRVVAHLHVGETEGFVEVVGELEDVPHGVVLRKYFTTFLISRLLLFLNFHLFNNKLQFIKCLRRRESNPEIWVKHTHHGNHHNYRQSLYPCV